MEFLTLITGIILMDYEMY